MKRFFLLAILILLFCTQILTAQSNYKWQQFVMGSDLSYVNQIEDAGGTYKGEFYNLSI
jgi:arabinogalactan endo-1,4-beta-galactosidase